MIKISYDKAIVSAFMFFGALSCLISPAWAEMNTTSASAAGGASSSRPNIIFILADDWGWGDLGCYGHRQLKTPNLDRLARQGTLFTQFYVCSGVCSPSRTAFMTGQYPARHRMHGHLATHEQNAARGMPDYLDPKVPTITRILHDAGYATAHYGKWHLGHGEGAPVPAEYGIDDYRCVASNGQTWETKGPGFRARSAGLIIDETIRFIEAHRDKPFFVQSWLLDTHAVLDPSEEQLVPYARYTPRGTNYKGTLQVYYGAATAADKEIGRLLQKLDDLGMSRNTIVIFSSDNGPEDIHLGEASHSGVGSAGPFRGRKRSLYEGGVRTPFIVRWPAGTPAGKVDKTSVLAGVDFLPTLCSITGAPLPSGLNLDGEDMSGPLRGTSRERSSSLFWDWRFGILGDVINKSPRLAIRDGQWKLLMNPDRSRVELYDILRDPMQVDNLAAQHSEVVERLSTLLLDWNKTLPPGPLDTDAGSNAYPWP